MAITNNSGSAYKGVDVNLLSGNVQGGSGANMRSYAAPAVAGAGAPLAADAGVESLGEQKLYTLPGKVTSRRREQAGPSLERHRHSCRP